MYRYIIINRLAPLTLWVDRAWYLSRQLNHESMHEAAQLLVGYHDFTTFRSVECQASSPMKTIDSIRIFREEDKIFIEVIAPSFLHKQVRSIVGSLEHIASGKWCKQDLDQALKVQDRRACGFVAPACGLYLVAVEYDIDP
jgi:tRNA pseudouridine38-40 synthase